MLSFLDKKIELQSKKIEDLKLYKKCIQNKMLNNIQVTNEKILGDILIEGNKIPVNDTSKYNKINIKLNFKGIEFNNATREMADTRPFYIRNSGEIIIGKQNYFNGSIAVITDKFNNTICSNAIMSFKVKEEYNNKYIYYYLSQPNYIKKRAFLANGTGQKELSEKEFLKFKIKLPEKKIQDDIVTRMDSINSKIELENSKLTKLQELKKGLMQQMFV